jgi:hypothetical protein
MEGDVFYRAPPPFDFMQTSLLAKRHDSIGNLVLCRQCWLADSFGPKCFARASRRRVITGALPAVITVTKHHTAGCANFAFASVRIPVERIRCTKPPYDLPARETKSGERAHALPGFRITHFNVSNDACYPPIRSEAHPRSRPAPPAAPGSTPSVATQPVQYRRTAARSPTGWRTPLPRSRRTPHSS